MFKAPSAQKSNNFALFIFYLKTMILGACTPKKVVEIADREERVKELAPKARICASTAGSEWLNAQ